MSLFQKTIRENGSELVVDAYGISALPSSFENAWLHAYRLRLFDDGGKPIATLRMDRGPIKFYSPDRRIHSAEVVSFNSPPTYPVAASFTEAVVSGTEDEFLPNLLPIGVDQAGTHFPHQGVVAIDAASPISAIPIPKLRDVGTAYQLTNVVTSIAGPGAAYKLWRVTIQNLGPNQIWAGNKNPPSPANSHVIQAAGDVWTLDLAGIDTLRLTCVAALQVSPLDTRVSWLAF